MKVLIIGGTGFLGFHATGQLLEHHHEVSALGLPPGPAEGLFPPEVEIHLGNMAEMTDDDLSSVFKDKDAIIFAAGVDDRVTPKKPAYPFFVKHNVDSVRRVFTLARQAGVKRGVVLGSYFAYFDRLWPEMKLSERHPYIRSRVEQTRAAFDAGQNELLVSVLELPYIFGSMPGNTPLWKPLLDYVFSPFPLFYPAGGTACVSVRQVAQAICGAVERGEPRTCYPIGGENLTWVQLLKKFGELGGKSKKVLTLPKWLVKLGARMLSLVHAIEGKESGLEPVAFIDLQTRNTFIDNTAVRAQIGYEEEDLTSALKDTLRACGY